jgi:hypothetical protein
VEVFIDFFICFPAAQGKQNHTPERRDAQHAKADPQTPIGPADSGRLVIRLKSNISGGFDRPFTGRR